MSVPRRTERDHAGWEVSGEQPTPTRRPQRPDKLGIGIVAMVLLAVVVAIVVLFVI
jgi:hypothetical protein